MNNEEKILSILEKKKLNEEEKLVLNSILREDPAAAIWGPVTVDAGLRILQINGKPPLQTGDPPGRPYMLAGIHVMEPAVLDAIPPGPGSIIDVYHALLGKGLLLRGWRMSGYWSDIGTRERYEQAERDAAEGRPAIL